MDAPSPLGRASDLVRRILLSLYFLHCARSSLGHLAYVNDIVLYSPHGSTPLISPAELHALEIRIGIRFYITPRNLHSKKSRFCGATSIRTYRATSTDSSSPNKLSDASTSSATSACHRSASLRHRDRQANLRATPYFQRLLDRVALLEDTTFSIISRAPDA